MREELHLCRKVSRGQQHLEQSLPAEDGRRCRTGGTPVRICTASSVQFSQARSVRFDGHQGSADKAGNPNQHREELKPGPEVVPKAENPFSPQALNLFST